MMDFFIVFVSCMFEFFVSVLYFVFLWLYHGDVQLLLFNAGATRFLFYKQLLFWFQTRVAKGFPCFQPQSCL